EQQDDRPDHDLQEQERKQENRKRGGKQREREQQNPEKDTEDNSKRQGEQEEHEGPPTDLLTCRRLYKFRRLQLIGRSAGGVRREVRHRPMADAFVEALYDERLAARGLLQLREPDDDAETDEENKDEHRRRREALHSPQHDLHDVVGHDSASPCGGLT